MADLNVKMYGTFRGVDYSASPAVISDDHASDMLNMYVGEDGVMQKRPGWRVLRQFENYSVNGIFYIQTGDTLYAFFHVGQKIFWCNAGPSGENLRKRGIIHGDLSTADIHTVINAALNTYVVEDHKSTAFEFEGDLYFLDGTKYRRIFKSGSDFIGEDVSGYIPTTAIDGYYKYDDLNEEGTNTPGSPENPGVWQAPQLYEKRNMIQTQQMQTFIADGIHRAYYLLENNNAINKVEMLLWTRCKAVNGVDTPTQDEKTDTFDAGTSPTTGIYYYYKYIWTEMGKPSEFATFSASTSYSYPDKVKRTVNDVTTYYICMKSHNGAWDEADFEETYAWIANDANSSTPQQNEISYSTKITFYKSAPKAHKEGIANIRVTFTPRKHSSDWAVNKDRGYINKCTIVGQYGYYNKNRFFFTGNPDHKAMDFASAVDDPTFFPDDGWTIIGSRLSAIKGYVLYGSDQIILKEDNNEDATLFVRSAQLTEDNEVIFPVKYGAKGFGTVSQYAVYTLRDDPMFLTKDGIFAVEGTDTTQERRIRNRSFYIDSKLRDELSENTQMIACGDYLIVYNGNSIPWKATCYVADARSIDKINGSPVYNWYKWDLNLYGNLTCMQVINGRLFFGTSDGKLCVFNVDWDNMERWSDGMVLNNSTLVYSEGEPIRAYYVTKRDHLGAVDFKKTMLNDGGVITLKPYEQSSAQILVKTEKGELFIDDIQTDSDEPSVVVPIRKRMKNFDSIQTTIENNRLNEGLSILGVQYRYAITTNRR